MEKIRLLITEIFISNEQRWVPIKSFRRKLTQSLIEGDFVIAEVVNFDGSKVLIWICNRSHFQQSIPKFATRNKYLIIEKYSTDTLSGSL